ncbi:MAG: PrsW family intramembrane metalloprotease [Armatimonadetes bacterium]|nr:PrsW family intramembrane metalloprotease [Armatimonadota bacterium]
MVLTRAGIRWCLAVLALLSLALVLGVELGLRDGRESGAGWIRHPWADLRGPAQLVAALSVGALLLSVLLAGRQRPPSTALVPVETVVEHRTFSAPVKALLLGISAVMAVVGGLAFAGIDVLLALTHSELAFALAVGCLVGGIITVVQVRHSLAGRPARRFRLPSVLMLGLGFVLVVAAGTVTLYLRQRVGFSFAPLLFLGAALPPLAALSVAAEGVGQPASARRVLVAMVAGGTASVIAAVMLEMLLPGIIALFVKPVADMIREVIALIDQGRFSDLFRSPAAIFALVQLAVVAPIAEEAVKPIGVMVLGRRIQCARDALLIGMGCGAGFAIVENIMYEGGGISIWAGITFVRAIGGALHPIGAGLVSLGWFGVFQRQPGRWRNLARNYLAAVGLHAIWNGACGIFYLLESAHRDVLGPVDLQGWVIDIGLLALFLVEGAFMFWAVRRIAQALAADAVPQPALPPARLLGLWAVACMGVLLPIAAAASRAVVRYLESGPSP